MPKFDANTALIVLGNEGSPIDALGMSFGVPNCLISFTKDALKLFPSSVLSPMSTDIDNGLSRALDVIADVKKKLLKENGIIEIDTESGIFKFISDSSRYGLDDNTDKALNNVGGFLATINKALQTGGSIYKDIQGVQNIIAGVEGCIESYNTWQNLNKGYSGNYKQKAGIDPVAEFSLEMEKVKEATVFISKCTSSLEAINDIMSERFIDPSLEPVLLDSDFLSGTDIITVSKQLESATNEPVFRLVFGPPKSKQGQFLLSVDGLYYDSQSGGLPEVSGFIAEGEKWKFAYDPNIGGKGKIITKNDLDNYVDTIFDLNKIDNSNEIKPHYVADHFLEVLESQKNKQVYDLSSMIGNYIASGYSDNSALVTNLRQQLISIAALHQNKINRRKKQIEGAVKAPLALGSDIFYKPGEVPVNDFSYLQGINLPIPVEKQKKLIFVQGEVSSVVLPLVPKFVKANEVGTAPNLDYLIVPPVGAGGIVFGPSSYTATNAAILSLTDQIITTNLIGIYNFLEPYVVSPSSTEFTVINCANPSSHGNAQLVANSAEEVFGSGLGIPLLKGIGVPSQSTWDLSSLGSYVKLPNTPQMQDWTYTPSGFTFETWLYHPNIAVSSSTVDPSLGWGTSAFHKVILGCENTGGVNKEETGKIFQNFSTDNVRGLLIGFTRDIQITGNTSALDASGSNPVSSIHFYMAPTRSYNASDISFISPLDQGCSPIYSILKFSMPITSVVGNKSFSQVSSNFMLVDTVVDVFKNEVRVYLDGVLMGTSSIPNVFGVSPFTTPNLPSFKATNSFEYSTSSTGLSLFANGPKNYNFFTPWILGSGWTDGNKNNGGFMGQNSGKVSGFGGRLGSVKFYSKPLSTAEVNINFEAQKGMFKNIVI